MQSDFTQPREHIAKRCGYVIQDIEKRILKTEVCIKFIVLATVVAYTQLRLALIMGRNVLTDGDSMWVNLPQKLCMLLLSRP